MTRFPYDQFAKDYLDGLLEPLGTVQTDKRVSAEIRQIDVYFVPSQSQSPEDIASLGLLGRLADKSGLFEPFRNGATVDEIRDSINKLFDTFSGLQRKAKANKQNKIKEQELPFLWILSPTASKKILKGFKADLDETQCGQGVYIFGEFLRGGIVIIHKLPRNQDTLWLRLLGRGAVQQQAIDELEALSVDNPLRTKALDALLSLRTTLQAKQDTNTDDRRFVMRLSPIYQQQLAEAEQRGRESAAQLYQQQLAEAEQRGRESAAQLYQQRQRVIIENLLSTRFGLLDEELRAIVSPLLTLSPEEFSRLLLDLPNISREDMLARFSQN
ncbi:MAG: hypothetical protein HC908_17365 [Calothrix sp. SM1_7_51]|nr:hypothetical protein [Calothrix sp. SM1_7_51]